MNKKKILIIIGICVLIAGVCFGFSKFKNQQDGVKVENVEKPSKGSAKVSEISGFNYEDSKEVGGLELPYRVSGTNLVIENIGQYTGAFVEDGSDAPKANVMSLLVTNNSKKAIQYGEIKLKINGNETVVFKVTNLPAGTSTLVMESTGNVEFNQDDKYECLDSIQAEIDKMPMNEDKIKIVKKEDGTIGIKNISNQDFETVYVYYKYFQKGGTYLGGITYRVKFENVKAGQKAEEKTSHYSKDFSDILMVDAY